MKLPSVGLMLVVVAGLLATPLAQTAPIVDAEPVQAERPAHGEKLRRAHEALASKQFDGADALFKEAARLAPQSPLPALGLAESARIRGQEAQVKSWLDEAARLAPKDSAVLTAWARWHYARKEFKMAEALWTQAAAADALVASPLVDLGDLYYNVHRKLAKAADYYRKALAIDPNLAGAHYALGMTQLDSGNPAAAMPSLREANRLSPNNPLALHALGRAQAASKAPEQALASFDAAIVAQANYYPARLAKGDLLFSLGKLDAALAEYVSVAKSQPKLSAPHVKTGMVYQQRKMYPEAMAAYGIAVAVDPAAAIAYNNMAWLAAERREQLDSALEWAGKAVALGPDEPRFRGTLGWVHRQRGELDKALAVLEKVAASTARSMPETHYLLGIVYADKGRKGDAANALRRALQIDPAFPGAADAREQLKKLQAS